MAITQEVRDHVHAWISGTVEVDYTALEQRFEEQVDRRDTHGCHPYTSGPASRYGVFTIKGVPVYAHRVAYRLAKGPIPKGMTIDHVKANGCTDTRCCNVEHLECVPRGINRNRARNMSVFT